MNFLTNKLKNIKPDFTSFTSALEKIQTYSKKVTNISKNLLIKITNNLYNMPFPTENIQQDLISQITSKFGLNYYIWNVSQNKYNTQIFNCQVSQSCFAAYPNLPLSELLLLAINIKKWLSKPNNVAIIHCKQDKSRSGILIAIYLYLDNKYEYLEQALIQVNRKLEINKQQTVFASQHQILKNCMNFLNGWQINTKPLKIVRIVMNEYPRLIRKNQDNSVDKLKLYVQLFSQNIKVAQSISKNISEQQEQQLSFKFDTIVKDDFLIWMKHYHNKNRRYSCLRILLDTNFIKQCYTRIYFKNIDCSKNITISPNFFIDLYVEHIQETGQNNLKIIQKQLRQVFKQFKFKQIKESINKNAVKQIKNTQIFQQKLKQLQQNPIIVAEQHQFSIGQQNTEKKKLTQISENVIKMIQQIHTTNKPDEQQEQDIDDYIAKLQQQL